MLIKRLSDCGEIAAGDATRLRELLHPERDAARVRYSLAVAWLAPDKSSLPHRLRSSEVYYLVGGSGVMHVGDESAEVAPGDAVYIPADAVQWLENTGKDEIEFICIVDPPWREKDEQLIGPQRCQNAGVGTARARGSSRLRSG
jgi:mannose-6-phosphate isomerase-like protein (cupin superfamily)